MKLTFSPDLQAELGQRQLGVVTGSMTDNFLDQADVVSIPSWPEFMMNDAVANRHWGNLHNLHGGFQFALYEETSKKWIAVGNSIPVKWAGKIDDLPDEGWDWALASGIENKEKPNLLCALAIQILPDHRGQGLSRIMIQVMREIGEYFGLHQLIAPVRPNKKCDYPLLSMSEYIKWSYQGERFDPWLRVHERLGARLVKICPLAMRIVGPVVQWEKWTGLSFQTSGEYIIPGALGPITINLKEDEGVYIEPNVWMLHQGSMNHK